VNLGMFGAQSSEFKKSRVAALATEVTVWPYSMGFAVNINKSS